MTPEARLWGEVLLAGLHDAARGKEPDWIRSEDFETVAFLAGIDPTHTREALKRKDAQ